jgi:hypothetical protein
VVPVGRSDEVDAEPPELPVEPVGEGERHRIGPREPVPGREWVRIRTEAV